MSPPCNRHVTTLAWERAVAKDGSVGGEVDVAAVDGQVGEEQEAEAEEGEREEREDGLRRLRRPANLSPSGFK